MNGVEAVLQGSMDNFWSARRAAAGVFLAACVVGVFAAVQMGVTWDEPQGHFEGVGPVVEWARGGAAALKEGRLGEFLSRDSLDAAWPVPDPRSERKIHPWNHPPVRLYLAVLCRALCPDAVPDVVAYRLASVFCFAGAAVLLFLFFDRRGQRTAGVAAALAWTTLPHVVGHAAVLSGDVPMVFFWLWALFLLDSPSAGHWPGVWAGAAWGVALASKFPASALPVPFLLYAWWVHRKEGAARLLAAVPVALFVAWALNPAWWHDPVTKVWQNHLLLSLTRARYHPAPTFFLGETYRPWAPPIYTPVMLLATAPLAVLAAAAWALWVAGKAKLFPAPLKLAAVHLGFFLWVGMSPGVPRHDGVRYLLPAMPFLAMLAGLGAAAFLSREWGPGVRRWIAGVAAAYQVLVLAAVSPHFLSFYGELAGGPRGARALGLESTYWFDALSPSACRWLNENLPPSAGLATWPRHEELLRYLQGAGWLRPDLKVEFASASHLLILSRQGMFIPAVWDVTRKGTPVKSFGFPGVPLLSVYAPDGEPASK